MQLQLQKMTAAQFPQFMNSQINEYAHQKIANHSWPAAGARQQAAEEFQMLLPDGLNTCHNYFYVLCSAAQDLYGYVWLAEVIDSDRPQQPYLFIYDYSILPDYQNQGYGQKGLELVFQVAQKLGYQSLGLHVFGQNYRAQHVYQKLGFVPTDIVMKKDLNSD